MKTFVNGLYFWGKFVKIGSDLVTSLLLFGKNEQRQLFSSYIFWTRTTFCELRLEGILAPGSLEGNILREF